MALGSDYGSAFLSNQWYPDGSIPCASGSDSGVGDGGFDLVSNLGRSFYRTSRERCCKENDDPPVGLASLGDCVLFSCSERLSYSVLTHEAIIDSTWDSAIKPLLLKRFPAATADELNGAHAYAYGGCIIQDLGYYPFGSKFFSDLTHYVRSGDFIST